MEIKRYGSEEWKEVSEWMHFNVFNETRPSYLNRIDYALVMWADEKPIAYFTCVESDSESVYIGYGGALPEIKKSVLAFRSYNQGIEYLSGIYKRATTLIENTNTPMLKMAMAVGFKITGIKNFKNIILLENSIEWGDLNG